MPLSRAPVVSVSWTTPSWLIDAFQERGLACLPRSSDWGLKGWRSRLKHLAEGVKIGRSLRSHVAVVAMTPGLEVFTASLTAKVLRAKGQLVVADFLMPQSRRGARLQTFLLRRVDCWVCIRSGDVATLGRRYGVSPVQTLFAHFPVVEPSLASPPVEPHGESLSVDVYAAGNAHRDWRTLFSALNGLDVRAVVSCPASQLDASVDGSWSAVAEMIPPQSPEDGRLHAQRAKLVVLPMTETELPSGPLVLLDAMVLGRPVVATDCNGTRDYIIDGETGWLVPAGDPKLLASSITRALSNEPERMRVAQNARTRALAEFTPARFVESIVLALDASIR